MKNKEDIIVTMSEEEYKSSKFCTKEWEQSVKITNWEHDFEKKKYTIKYEKK